MNEEYIKRELFEDVADHLDKPEITLITGSRQVGKTILLHQLRQWLLESKRVSPDMIMSYNLDLVQDWQSFQNQQDFIEFLKGRSSRGRLYVFVDEAQKVPNAASFFKGVYDSGLNIKLILTGSSSLELKARFKETLAGRKLVFQLSPFTFLESLRYRDQALAERLRHGQPLPRLEENALRRRYAEYAVFGGYPRVVKAEHREEKRMILQEIYSSYVEQDAMGFLNIKNKAAFSRLIKLLAAQIGQLVNLHELAANLAVDRGTVERYITALEDTFIIKRLSPYFTNPRQEIIKTGKIYFLDTGIRNVALENFESLDERVDQGGLFEQAIFTEINSRRRTMFQAVRFWRTKHKTEVDFVIEEGKVLIPIEVKFSADTQTVPSGLAGFIEKFNPAQAYIVAFNESAAASRNVGSTVLAITYPFYLCGIIQNKK